MSNNNLKFGILTLIIIVVISGVIFYNNNKQGDDKLIIKEDKFIKEDQFKQKDNNLSKQEKESNYGLGIGNYAPEFSLDDLTGEEVSLSDFRGKYIMLNFWASWCPPCRKEMPDLDQFYQENKDQFVVLGVNIGEDKKTVKKFINDRGYNYPVLLDQSRQLSFVYRASVIPTSYFIDQEGKIQYIKRGLVSKSELDQIKKNLMNRE
ncbi:TlpA family protein disulfide reductase [Orenia marismortui]|uniref:TlpA family protein disulfide reductase n=1 Tax=Orenia marismortui TaxID=46469 RepID=UPI00036C51B6|nr:TlpA disulfide reductase family protein [Orenia marismortui]